MLIEDKTKRLVTIKLSNGDELMAFLESETKEYLYVEHPLGLALNVDQEDNNKTVVIFVPWIYSGNTSRVEISKNQVTAMCEPREEASAQYKNAIQ